ncbi:MAG: tyrosine recombinase XerC [Huintestinicola sp.]
MANITPRTNKDGSVVYRIRVSAGRKADGTQQNAYQTTWRPDPNKSERANAKALNEFTVKFESDCKAGAITAERRKFGEYGRYIVHLKFKHGGLKNSTTERYMSLFAHMTELDGISLEKITPQTLTNLYEKLLSAPTLDSQRYSLRRKIDPMQLSKCNNKSEFCRKHGLAVTTFNAVLKGDNVTTSTAEKLSNALDMPISALFNSENTGETLSPKTVREIHVLISMILNEAVRDGIITSNPAERARLPKSEKHEAEFLEPDELAEVLSAADREQSNIRLFVYLLAASGGRRGEVIGLRWRDVNFEFGQIHFEQTVLYRKNLGIYTDTPKNEKSDRFLRLPPEMMKMLADYKEEWERFRTACGSSYPKRIKLPNGSGQVKDIETDFIFTQSKRFGYPINPDTTNGWLNKLSEKYGLKPLHPHMFRHSAASTLIYAGVDVVSVAGYLGHATPTTTVNIPYGHTHQSSYISI